MRKLEGKRALITGGTSGIGLATAQHFEHEGARVMVTGRHLNKIRHAQKKLSADAVIVSSDAGKIDSINSLMQAAHKHFNELDILFINAGDFKIQAPEQVTERDFDATIETNLKSVYFTLQKAIPYLSNGAAVLITTSISNQLATPNGSIYAAAKAGVRSLVKSFALHLIDRKIRVNAISPGPIDTPIFQRAGLDKESLFSMRQMMVERNPSKRLGLPEEIAAVAVFLASAEAAYVVGQEIIVDGGRTLL